MCKAIVLLAISAVLGGCSTLPRWSSDVGRRAEAALRQAISAYCRLPAADREEMRRTLAERHGLDLPRDIGCRGDSARPSLG